MTETCPSCGAEASGRFCNQCGAALAAACRDCGSPLPRGARFCNECGAAATAQAQAAAPATRSSMLPWAVAGLAVAALAAVVLVPKLSAPATPPGDAAAAQQAPFAPAASAGGGAAAVDLSQMTPREAADRLFNRVMTAVSGGDSAQAKQFLPMAVSAYRQAGELDADGHYHLAALYLVGGDYDSARAEADSILAKSPTHLFGLFTAAQAAQGKGDAAGAAALYRRFVQSYDAEVKKGLPEYQEHQQGLPGMKAVAEQAAAGK